MADPIVDATGAGSSTTVQVETVTIPKKDFDDLSHRADVSSQNFTRLKKAEETIEELKAQLDPLNLGGDTTANDTRVVALEQQVATLTANLTKNEILEKFPQIKEAWADFEAYQQLPENKGMALGTAAKAFLTEKGLLDSRRTGLERPTGGDPAPVRTGKLSAEEAKTLRNTNYEEYRKALKRGDITIE